MKSLDFLSIVEVIRDLKQTYVVMAMRTWQNKRSNGKNNSSSCEYLNFVLFLAILCKKKKKDNVKSLKFAWLENRNPDSKLIKFPFGTKHCCQCYAVVFVGLIKFFQEIETFAES